LAWVAGYAVSGSGSVLVSQKRTEQGNSLVRDLNVALEPFDLPNHQIEPPGQGSRARVLGHGGDAERGGRVVAKIERAGGAAPFFRADLASLAAGLPLRYRRQRAGSTS
jgi:hypothetical protein